MIKVGGSTKPQPITKNDHDDQTRWQTRIGHKASSGIGEAVARRLAAASSTVTVKCRSHQKEPYKIVAKIKSAGGMATAIQADVSKEHHDCA